MRARPLVPFTNSTMMMVITKADSPNVNRAIPWFTPLRNNAPTTITPTMTGMRKFFTRLRREAFRHAMTGPIPIKASSANPIGRLTRLKNGGPTAMAWPVRPSVMSGNSVPHRMGRPHLEE